MVPDDQPLNLQDPPTVFISYQWGIQDKAKSLKDYLTNAGFHCWMDIGMIYTDYNINGVWYECVISHLQENHLNVQ